MNYGIERQTRSFLRHPFLNRIPRRMALLALTLALPSVSFATPPVVTITSPAPGLTNDNTPLLSYSVSDGTITVKVDGTTVSKVSGESLDQLNDGQYNVRVDVVNPGGETGSAEVVFTVDTTQPDQMGFTKVSSGKGHTMMLRADGTLWAAGENDLGQLGNGTFTNSPQPVRINAPGEADTRWKAVAAGWKHTLAIKQDNGSLWAWGYDGYGQLGDGSTNTNRNKPSMIDNARQWAGVAGGFYHSIAVTSDGAVYTWGDNTYGQLGDGSTTGRNSIPLTAAVSGGLTVAAGYFHSLALLTNGTLYAWGNNNNGQVGIGTQTQQLSPVSLGSGWLRIAGGGYHSLAIKRTEDGLDSLWAWGGNWDGQIGNGSTAVQTTPVRTGGAFSWLRLSAGSSHSLAVRSDGTLWGWGTNMYQQIGPDAAVIQLTPIQIGTESDWSELAGGQYHSVALKADGTVWAWSDNAYGISNRTTPYPISGTEQWADAASGYYHSVGIKSADGSLWAWGYNNNGQLGDNTLVNKSVPASVQVTHTNVPRWSKVAAGALHTLAIGSDGSLWAWGDNNFGQLGNGSTPADSKIPVKIEVALNPTWISVAAGTNHSLALTSNGELYAWGKNTFGQVGTGSVVDQSTPVSISAGSGRYWTRIAAGENYTLAIKDDNSLWAWGYNSFGSLGIGSTTHQLTPVQILLTGGTSTWSAVSAGAFHVLAIHTDGSLYGWGANWYYEVGDGTATMRTTPVRISNDPVWVSVHAGQYYSLAATTNGDIFGWGFNGYGQLGNSTNATIQRPTSTGTGAAWSGISTKFGHTLAIKNDGSLWSWGYDAYGQLGDGAPVDRSSPVQIATPIKINGGEWQTKSATVTLSLDAGDENGVAEMQFSNDGTTWASQPEPYSETKTWSLSGDDGIKNVYARFRDTAGNWSSSFADSITLDRTPPAVAITSLCAGISSDPTPVLVYSVSHGSVLVKVDDIVVSKSSGDSLDALANGIHTIRVEATDAAGNVGFDEKVITIDTNFSTTVGGRIDQDTTWSFCGSPYIVTSTVQVYGTTTIPVTLTIEPGVVVKFNSYQGLQIGSGANQGALVAQGTETNRITFTRSGSSGYWSYLSFQDGTVDSTTVIEYTDIQYSTGVAMSSASPVIKNSIIADLAGYVSLSYSNAIFENVAISSDGAYGMYLTSSSPVISGGNLTNASSAGHGIYGSGSPVISNYTVSLLNSANKYGVYLNSTTSALFITNSTIGNGLYLASVNISPTITGNTFTNFYNSPLRAGANIVARMLDENMITGWTDAQGQNPNNAMINVAIEAVTQDATWKKWPAPYAIPGLLYVYRNSAAASTLTIEPGAILKFSDGGALIIGQGASKGALIARGTSENPILFTSSSATPVPGIWWGITFNSAASASSVMEHVIVEYGGKGGATANANITVNTSSPAIKNALLRKSLGSGISFSSVTLSPLILDSEISDNTWGVYSYNSNPSIRNTMLTGNATRGILNGTTGIQVDALHNWWGHYTGPRHNSNPNGLGDIVSDGVNFNPWLGQVPGSTFLINNAKVAPLSLNPDGDYALFTGTVTASADWSITITDGSNVMKTFSGTGTVLSQKWHGEDASDIVKVPDGGYFYTMQALHPSTGEIATVAGGPILVSRQIPVAILDLPADHQMFPGGAVITIRGTAADSTDFKSYTLSYGSGEYPAAWHTIMTATTPVTNGVLHAWNTSALAEGVYTLRLTVTDNANNIAEETVPVRLLWTQNAASSEAIISPNNDAVKDATTISATFTHESAWKVIVKDSSNAIVRTYLGSGASVTWTWDGRNEAAAVVPDGDYVYQIDAIHTETGVVASSVTGSVTVDNAAPVALIAAPSAGAILRNVTAVSGTASDAHLEIYRLEYGPESGAGPWVEIISSTSTVTAGFLGNWTTNDQTDALLLQNGTYALRLTARDRAGNSADTVVPVSVSNLLLTEVSASSAVIDTFSGGTSTIFYTISAPSTIQLKVIPEAQGPSGTPVYTASQGLTAGGPGSFVWDGKNSAGVVVSNEAYLYILEASDGSGSDTYSPAALTGEGTITCTQDTYDPYKNDPLTISYVVAQPARVDLTIGWSHSIFKIMDAVPHVPGSYTYDWDGRNPTGAILAAAGVGHCAVASLLRENHIIVQGGDVNITLLKTDPYMMQPAYGQFAKIQYHLSRDAIVTVQLISPSGSTVTLLSGQPQEAGTHTLSWDGIDASDTMSKQFVFSEDGDYTVLVQAVNSVTGASAERKGCLRVGDN